MAESADILPHSDCSDVGDDGDNDGDDGDDGDGDADYVTTARGQLDTDILQHNVDEDEYLISQDRMCIVNLWSIA